MNFVEIASAWAVELVSGAENERICHCSRTPCPSTTKQNIANIKNGTQFVAWRECKLLHTFPSYLRVCFNSFHLLLNNAIAVVNAPKQPQFRAEDSRHERLEAVTPLKQRRIQNSAELC
jgi:hypothetical protein